MPKSNFTKGFRDGVTLRNNPMYESHGGNVFWVDSGTGSDSNPKGTFDAPFATIDYAIGKCTANNGDVIFVKPGHTEDLDAAADIDVDVAGISIRGIGTGSDQPAITFSNAAATFEVNTDNVWIDNLHFQATVTGVLQGVDVLDGSDDGKITNCRFSAETLGTDEFVDALVITTSDRWVVEDNVADMDEAGAASWLQIVGACLGMTVRRNTVLGDYSVAPIEGTTAAAEQVLIDGNTLVNGVHSGLNTVACISLFTGTTGFIQNNNLYTNVTNAATAAISADGCFLGENTISSTAESAPLQAESLGLGRLEVTSIANVECNDEGEATVTFACNGPLDIYGVWGVMTTAADETEEMTLSLESGTTLMALGEIHTATAAGDVFFAATVGATPTVDEVGTAEQHVFSNPLRVTGTEDLIDMLAEGDIDGGGECTLYVLWSPVVAGAEIQTS